MKNRKEVINGKEKEDKGTAPETALVQFYRAFNGRNMKLMSQNWANDGDIAMDNPLGGIMRSWEDIRKVYKRIFEGPAKVYVEFYDYTIHESDNLFYAVGRERGYLKKEQEKLNLEIRTSRIFKKINEQWKQVHHHGSIEDPNLLQAYQQIVKN